MRASSVTGRFLFFQLLVTKCRPANVLPGGGSDRHEQTPPVSCEQSLSAHLP